VARPTLVFFLFLAFLALWSGSARVHQTTADEHAATSFYAAPDDAQVTQADEDVDADGILLPATKTITPAPAQYGLCSQVYSSISAAKRGAPPRA
jgi:hypothetical protein